MKLNTVNRQCRSSCRTEANVSLIPSEKLVRRDRRPTAEKFASHSRHLRTYFATITWGPIVKGWAKEEGPCWYGCCSLCVGPICAHAFTSPFLEPCCSHCGARSHSNILAANMWGLQPLFEPPWGPGLINEEWAWMVWLVSEPASVISTN